jgi:hypothetical protein
MGILAVPERGNVTETISRREFNFSYKDFALAFCSPMWRNDCIAWELCWVGAIKQVKDE